MKTLFKILIIVFIFLFINNLYSQFGNGWDRFYEDQNLTNGNSQAYAIALDGNGNVYVTGMSDDQGDPNDYTPVQTIKYNSTGVQQWISKFPDWDQTPGWNYNGESRGVSMATYYDNILDRQLIYTT